MTAWVFAAIIASAFLQATWNFFAKKSTSNKTALLLVGWLLFGSLAIVPSILLTDLSSLTSTSIKYIALSSFVHCIYVFLLGWAYTIGDISVVYPVSRGLGIALTAFFAAVLQIDHISNTGFLGIACIVIGIFFMGMREIYRRKGSSGFMAAVLVAISVSCYSLIDSRAAQHVPGLFLIACINLLTIFFALPILCTKLKQPVLEVLQFRKNEALMIAASGSAAYLIILWAYTQTSTSYVVAMREFSIVIASGYGIFLLKEKLYKSKILALLCITIGIALLKMA
ncbi:MAG: DMT family transporter [Bdellovibrionota bacterium]